MCAACLLNPLNFASIARALPLEAMSYMLSPWATILTAFQTLSPTLDRTICATPQLLVVLWEKALGKRECSTRFYKSILESLGWVAVSHRYGYGSSFRDLRRGAAPWATTGKWVDVSFCSWTLYPSVQGQSQHMSTPCCVLALSDVQTVFVE